MCPTILLVVFYIKNDYDALRDHIYTPLKSMLQPAIQARTIVSADVSQALEKEIFNVVAEAEKVSELFQFVVTAALSGGDSNLFSSLVHTLIEGWWWAAMMKPFGVMVSDFGLWLLTGMRNSLDGGKLKQFLWALLPAVLFQGHTEMILLVSVWGMKLVWSVLTAFACLIIFPPREETMGALKYINLLIAGPMIAYLLEPFLSHQLTGSILWFAATFYVNQ